MNNLQLSEMRNQLWNSTCLMKNIIFVTCIVLVCSQNQTVVLEIMASNHSDGSTAIVTVGASRNDDILAKSMEFCSEVDAFDKSECSYTIYFLLETELMKKCDDRLEQCINSAVPDSILEANQRQWLNTLPSFYDHYRSFVGQIEEYGSQSSSFFVLLASFGLKDSHRLLDVGCGSLRLGKLLIPFLNRGHYFCLEPNSWLHKLSIQYELGKDILHLKKPTFVDNDDFSVPEDFGSMDFVFANSIFSHAAPDLLDLAVRNVAKVMDDQSVFLASFFIEGISTFDGIASDRHRYDQEGLSGWFYENALVTYEEDFLHSFFGKYGLFIKRVAFPHVRQTWYAIARDKEYLENLVSKSRTYSIS